ncbi:uncharacterized protein LOC125214349 [Salvia hispanica]|uniref:uncharacterized protein LOC125214349 n=1 Tax=Salvia hispanica TaxID=49212 RepID=UPI0020097ECC|nr:uncharacterized protein LOC125214349 [Salvia hispanica]
MTPIFPKHFAYLLSRNSPFLCKSRVPFSTSTAKNPIINPTVYNVLLHEHNFSPESAAKAASIISRLRNPQKSDSLFSYLKKNGFSGSHLETIVKYNPSFVSADLEKSIKPKIELFQELGLSNSDIADLVTDNASILFRSTDKVVIPALSLLRSLLGSDANVVNLLKKSGWFLIKDLDKSMVPNIEFLKGRGVPTEQIIACLHSFSRTLLQKPGKLRRAAERAEELGARPGSGMYIHGVRVIASMSDEVWEAKLGAFRELGFSDEEIVNGFSKYPPAFAVSLRKMREVKDVLVSTGKYGVASIVAYPICFCGSVEKRLRPRIRVLAALEEKRLIKKWPSLATLCSLSDVRFFERFVKPYLDEVGHLFRI